MDSLELAKLQTHKNEWHSRVARRLLQEHALAGKDLGQAREAMLELYRSGKTAAHRLRAMWVLQSIGAVDEAWLLEQSHDENEHVRVWSIKLLTDAGAVSDEALTGSSGLAKSESSGLEQPASGLRAAPAAAWPSAGIGQRVGRERHVRQGSCFAVDDLVRNQPGRGCRLHRRHRFHLELQNTQAPHLHRPPPCRKAGSRPGQWINAAEVFC